MDLYLAVGNQTLADAVCLDDGINTFIPATMIAAGGVSLPAGINFGAHQRGVYNKKQQALPFGTRELTMTVICSGPDTNAVEATWRSIQQKLIQAELAAGPYGIGTKVCLWERPAGGSAFVFWDVLGGSYTYAFMGQPDGAPFKAGVLTLYVMPTASGALITSPSTGPYPSGALSNVFSFPSVPGDQEALLQLQIEDDSTSGHLINRITVGRRWLRAMAVSDFSPNLQCFSAGISSDFPRTSDATIISPNAARSSPSTTAFQQVASIFGGSGPANNGLFDVWVRVRDWSNPAYAPTSVAAATAQTGGNLPGGQLFTYLVTAQDGHGHESLPSAAASVTTPNPVSTFFDDANAGDPSFTVWDAFGLSVGGTNATAAGLSPSAQAAYEGSFGYRAEAAIGPAAGQTARAFLVKVPGSGRVVGDIQFRMRVNSVSAQTGGTTPAFPYIPIVFDSSNKPIIGFQFSGAGWQLGAVTAPNPTGEMVNLTAVPFPNTGEWVQVEVQVNGTAPTDVWVWINGALVVNQANMGNLAPARMGLGAIAESVSTAGAVTGNAALSVDFDLIAVYTDFIGEGVAENTVTWQPSNALPSGGGYNLYWQENGGRWHQVALGNVTSYTHSALSAGSLVDPPSGPPALALVELQGYVTAITGGGTAFSLRPGPVVSAQVGNGQWELVKLGTFELPPQVRNQTAPAVSDSWVIAVYARWGGSSTPFVDTLDLDTCYLVPVGTDEDVFVAEMPGATNTADGFVFMLETRYDGLSSCRLVAKGSGASWGSIPVSGRLALGPGDNQLVILVESTDGAGHFVHDAATQFRVQALYTPRYEHTTGVP